jgi:hypothetical protein
MEANGTPKLNVAELERNETALDTEKKGNKSVLRLVASPFRWLKSGSDGLPKARASSAGPSEARPRVEWSPLQNRRGILINSYELDS